MVVWLNRAVIVFLCPEFCYFKDIKIYIVSWIINNNPATEITHLQKNMVASPQESSPLREFSSPSPSQNSAPPPLPLPLPPDSKLPQLLKSNQSYIFFQPPSPLLFTREGAFYDNYPSDLSFRVNVQYLPTPKTLFEGYFHPRKAFSDYILNGDSISRIRESLHIN